MGVSARCVCLTTNKYKKQRSTVNANGKKGSSTAYSYLVYYVLSPGDTALEGTRNSSEAGAWFVRVQQPGVTYCGKLVIPAVHSVNVLPFLRRRNLPRDASRDFFRLFHVRGTAERPAPGVSRGGLLHAQSSTPKPQRPNVHCRVHTKPRIAICQKCT